MSFWFVTNDTDWRATLLPQVSSHNDESWIIPNTLFCNKSSCILSKTRQDSLLVVIQAQIHLNSLRRRLTPKSRAEFHGPDVRLCFTIGQDVLAIFSTVLEVVKNVSWYGFDEWSIWDPQIIINVLYPETMRHGMIATKTTAATD